MAKSKNLEKLAADKDANVRYGVAGNPNTPASLLKKLAADEDEYVRYGAAGNPNAPAALLEKLVADKDENVRRVAAENPDTPSSALEKLAADEDKNVRSAAAENPNTPASLLENLAADQKGATKIVVEQINNLASTFGEPVKCTAQYLAVIEEEREMGTFTGVGDKSTEIDGYTVWENKTGGDIAWNLPDSLDDFLAVLEEIQWTESEDETDISYDEMDFPNSAGKGSTGFDNSDKEITKYDEFKGEGDTEVIYLYSEYEPAEITITYENGQKVVFDRTETDNWTVKIALEPSKNLPDYEAVLLSVRTLLGK